MIVSNFTESLDPGHCLESLAQYKPGEHEKRVWGTFNVLDAGFKNGEEFCEKNLTIFPRQALSLQRHEGRSETWIVKEGNLTVIINGNLYEIGKGETVIVPLRAVHCMINRTNQRVVVHEKQLGICRERDSNRLSDFNGRATIPVSGYDIEALESMRLYRKVTAELRSNNAFWYNSNAVPDLLEAVA